MSIVSVKVKSLPGGQADYKGNTSYTAVFGVETDDPTDGIITVGEAVDPGGLAIPTPGVSVYQFNAKETDLSAVCTSVSPALADPSQSLTYWLVTCEYSTQTQQNQDSPLTRPLLINISSQKYEQAVIKDRDGNGIVNTVGDPFDPPLMMDGTRMFLTLTKNFAAYNFDGATAILDYVNSSLFYGIAAGKLKFDEFNASRQFEQDIEFWTCTAGFSFRREGWALQPLNTGMRCKRSGSVKICTEDNTTGGTPVLAPIPLNEDGTQNTSPTVSNAYYLNFNVYPETDFSALGFF